VAEPVKLGQNKLQHRVVLDTNVLVAAAYASASASRRIVEACLRDELTAIVSEETVREHRYILDRAVRSGAYLESLDQLLASSTRVVPEHTPRHVPQDADDDKFLAAAVAGQARWIVTNDQHLLTLDPYWKVRIVRPGEFVELIELPTLGGGHRTP
jgi:putative PIN family toxin of toxin-antitoxin system